MTQHRDVLWVSHILEAVVSIQKTIADCTYEQWMSAPNAVPAVLYNLAIIGEASAKLSPSLRDHCATIPWGDVIGLRNVIIHEYFGLDYTLIWHTITVDLPVFTAQIEKIHRELS